MSNRKKPPDDLRYDNRRDYIREIVVIVTAQVQEILETVEHSLPDSPERSDLLAKIRPRYQKYPDRWSYALQQAREIGELAVFSPLIMNLHRTYDQLTDKFLTCLPESLDWVTSRDNVFNAINEVIVHLDAADSAWIRTTTLSEEIKTLRKALEMSGGKGSTAKERTDIRIAKVIRSSPPMSSPKVAKLADTTDGTVRNSAAWRNRKQLWNTAKKTRKGSKDKDSRIIEADGTEADIPQAEHYDIYEMIQKCKTGKLPTYPTAKQIAEKLTTDDDIVTEERARQLLKETKRHFPHIT